MISQERTEWKSGETVCYLSTSGTAIKVYTKPDIWQTECGSKAPGGNLRGKIKGRSSVSRRRFQFTLARINHASEQVQKGVIFLTLTWKGNVPDHKQQEANLDAYLKFIERKFGKVPVCWAKEKGKVGARWHFHLVVFRATWVHVSVYQEAWNRLAGCHAGNVDVEFKRNSSVVRYLAKYMSKEIGTWEYDNAPEVEPAPVGDDGDEGAVTPPEAVPVDSGSAHISPKEYTGRTWGWRRYNLLSTYAWEKSRITVQMAHKIRRVLAKMAVGQVRKSIAQWEGWHKAYKEGNHAGYPDWLKGYYRRNRDKNQWFTMEFMFLVKVGKEVEKLKRLKTWGSWLTRSGFDRHGYSGFFENIGETVQKLVAYSTIVE